MAISPISPVPPIDFSTEELDSGDTTAFIQKMNAYQSKLEVWSQAIHGQADELVNMRTEIQDAIDEINTIAASAYNRSTTAITSATNAGNTANSAAGVASAAATTAEAGVQDTELASILLKIQNEQPNIIRGGGSFLVPDNVSDLSYGGPVFDATAIADYFEPFNGSNVLEPANGPALTWLYNSVDYGGTAEAQSATMAALAVHMGISDWVTVRPRYIPNFAVIQVTSGIEQTGATVDGKYQFLRTLGAYRAGAVNSATSISYWYQSFDEDSILGRSVNGTNGIFQNVYVDGALTVGDTVLSRSRVYHIALSYDAVDGLGIANLTPIYADPDTRHRIWLPRLAHGAFQLLPHRQPVRSYPGLSA